MVNYTCPRSNYNTNIKTIYVRHLSRKYICNNIISDDNLQNEYIKYNIVNKLKSDDNLLGGSKIFHKCSKITNNCSKITQYQSLIIDMVIRISEQGIWMSEQKGKNDFRTQ